MQDTPLLQRVPTGQSCIQQDCRTGRCSTGEMFSVGEIAGLPPDAWTMVWLQTSFEFGLCCCPSDQEAHRALLTQHSAPPPFPTESRTLHANFYPMGGPPSVLPKSRMAAASRRGQQGSPAFSGSCFQSSCTSNLATASPAGLTHTLCLLVFSSASAPGHALLLATQMKSPFPAVLERRGEPRLQEGHMMPFTQEPLFLGNV